MYTANFHIESLVCHELGAGCLYFFTLFNIAKRDYKVFETKLWQKEKRCIVTPSNKYLTIISMRYFAKYLMHYYEKN